MYTPIHKWQLYCLSGQTGLDALLQYVLAELLGGRFGEAFRLAWDEGPHTRPHHIMLHSTSPHCHITLCYTPLVHIALHVIAI